MSWITRYQILAAVSAATVAFAFGCTSTSTAPEPETSEVEAKPVPIAEAEPVEKTEVSMKVEPVYFDTDRSTLRPEARDSLKQYAKSITEHPEWGVIVIDGHCDERGSDAYNLALGARRAKAVESYLVDQGVPKSRLDTQSFGSRRPAVTGHQESAWRYNRRTELHPGDVLASTNR